MHQHLAIEMTPLDCEGDCDNFKTAHKVLSEHMSLKDIVLIFGLVIYYIERASWYKHADICTCT